jgi:hypothetical protein
LGSFCGMSLTRSTSPAKPFMLRTRPRIGQADLLCPTYCVTLRNDNRVR